MLQQCVQIQQVEDLTAEFEQGEVSQEPCRGEGFLSAENTPDSSAVTNARNLLKSHKGQGKEENRLALLVGNEDWQLGAGTRVVGVDYHTADEESDCRHEHGGRFHLEELLLEKLKFLEIALIGRLSL